MRTINEEFVCIQCKKYVPKALHTCRNHCPYCFTSVHVDGNIPGDRKSPCNGTMFPIAYERKSTEVKICFCCTKCGKIHRNKQASDDDITKLEELIYFYKKFF